VVSHSVFLPLALVLMAEPGASLTLTGPDLDLHLRPRLLWVEPDANDVVPSVEPEDAPTLAIGLASTGLALGILAFGSQAWWDEGIQPFSLRETGFFGRDTYAGGSDKMGHMFGSLVSLNIMVHVYEGLGLDPVTAVWGSALFTGVLFNGIELIDGFTKFGFEYGDVVMNTLGMGFGVLAHLVPTVDALFGMRLGYVPSPDFLRYDKSVVKFINDYTGMMFFFDLKLKGVFELAGQDPGWARFINVGAAFTTDQYSPVKVWEERQRLFGPHVGVNFAEVMRAISDDDVWVLRFARFFEMYAVGGLSVILLRDLNNDRWILNFGVSNRLEVPF
jgi:hypothetical protein